MLPTVPKLHETIIAPTDPGNPRNGEASMIALRNGHLLFTWTRFTGGGRDHSGAEIWVRTSDDGGFTWDKPFLLQKNIGACNVMCAGFLRLRSGGLLFGFAVKNHPSEDCRYYVRRSQNDGQTWGDPILTIPEPGYFVVNNVCQHHILRREHSADLLCGRGWRAEPARPQTVHRIHGCLDGRSCIDKVLPFAGNEKKGYNPGTHETYRPVDKQKERYLSRKVRS